MCIGGGLAAGLFETVNRGYEHHLEGGPSRWPRAGTK